MKKINTEKIVNIARMIGTRVGATFMNVPIACKRAYIKLQLVSDRSFLRDAEEDVEKLTKESESRHKRLGRQDFNNIVTMEIDSRMILAMDERKKYQKKIEEKEASLSFLSYK